jgi:hypothetical protein
MMKRFESRDIYLQLVYDKPFHHSNHVIYIYDYGSGTIISRDSNDEKIHRTRAIVRYISHDSNDKKVYRTRAVDIYPVIQMMKNLFIIGIM